MASTQSILDPPQIVRHDWQIKNFCHYFRYIDKNRSVTLLSDQFKLNNCDNHTFFFKLTIFSKSISCSLYRTPKTKFSCVACGLWFKFGDKWRSRRYIMEYCEESSQALATLVCESDDLLSKEKRETLFPDNHLTVVSEFTMLNDFATTQRIYTPQRCKSLKAHLEELLSSGNNSDVIFEVEDEEFKAHKSILSARSPVFAAMFEHDMVENQTNRVKIEDITEPVFNLLLHFIYTDELPTELDVDIGLPLLQAACKYQLDGLQNLCEEQLFSLITTKIATEFRAIAEANNLTNFMKSVKSFIKSHSILD